MKNSMKMGIGLSAGLAVGVMLWTGIAVAQGKPTGCDKASTPERLEGQVVKIDLEHGKVTVRATDGTTHEFQGCDKASTPERLEGRVVKIDLEQGKMTVRATDGTTHEFQTSNETLQGYKLGDRIEAKLRSAPDCK